MRSLLASLIFTCQLNICCGGYEMSTSQEKSRDTPKRDADASDTYGLPVFSVKTDDGCLWRVWRVQAPGEVIYIGTCYCQRGGSDGPKCSIGVTR